MYKIIYFLIAVMALFYYPVTHGQIATIETMQEELVQQEGKGGYVHVDLGLNATESLLFDSLKIEGSKKLDRFGDLHLLREEVALILKEMGNEDEETVQASADLIYRLVQEVVAASHQESAWVSIRAHEPSAAYDTPRWHVDGGGYGLGTLPLYPETTAKFVVTLKGPSTLMHDAPADLREAFIAHYDDREYLSTLLDVHNADSAGPSQGTFFIVGDAHRGAIHSEPSCPEGRLFLSIVTGSKKDVQELFRRREVQTSRDSVEGGKSWEESNLDFENTYWTRGWEREEKNDYKPSVGQVLTSSQQSYTLTKVLDETFAKTRYVAVNSAGQEVMVNWYATSGSEEQTSEFSIGEQLDYPTIIKSIETFDNVNVLEFVDAETLSQVAEMGIAPDQAIALAKQYVQTMGYLYSQGYFYYCWDVDEQLLNPRLELKLLVESWRLDPADDDFDYQAEQIGDAVVEILAKGMSSPSTKVANRVQIMQLVWTYQAYLEEGASVPFEDYLRDLETLLEGWL